MSNDYPGKGHWWADFLHHRARAIDGLYAGEGDPACKGNDVMIARTLSMDSTQVTDIRLRIRTPEEPPCVANKNDGVFYVCRCSKCRAAYQLMPGPNVDEVKEKAAASAREKSGTARPQWPSFEWWMCAGKPKP